MTGKTRVLLGLGSNLGDRKTYLDRAVAMIAEEIGKVTSLSSYIETAPWGFESEHRFLNGVVEVETTMAPMAVLEATQTIERRMGREQKSVDGKYSDRVIDIDILLYGQLVMNDERLVLPHPHLLERDFVMIPLCEIAGEMVHPLSGKRLCELKSGKKL